jgi:hypothetical protein
MKAKIASAAVGFLIISGMGGIASATNCKDVTVKVTNNFVHAGNQLQIKVVDFDYWDNNDAKWREEFGVDNTIVDYSRTKKIATRDLEHVGGEKGVRIRVQYKYLSGSSGNWSEILNAESGTFTCNADGPNTVIVTVTGV